MKGLKSQECSKFQFGGGNDNEKHNSLTVQPVPVLKFF